MFVFLVRSILQLFVRENCSPEASAHWQEVHRDNRFAGYSILSCLRNGDIQLIALGNMTGLIQLLRWSKGDVGTQTLLGRATFAFLENAYSRQDQSN